MFCENQVVCNLSAHSDLSIGVSLVNFLMVRRGTSVGIRRWWFSKSASVIAALMVKLMEDCFNRLAFLMRVISVGYQLYTCVYVIRM